MRIRGCAHRAALDEGWRGPTAGGMCTLLFPLELSQLQRSGNARVGQRGALRRVPRPVHGLQQSPWENDEG